MRTLGLIVEYNPFHNGHLYHIKKAAEMINPEIIVGVMSGNFVQRGEPSICRKQTKVKSSLDAGIDLIIELPFVFAIQDAGGFASGSIKILEKLKTMFLVFGSESNDIESLEEISTILNKSSDEYNSLLKKFLKEGLSFPNARKEALKEYLKSKNKNPDIVDKIALSNDILGLEYLKGIKKIHSSIQTFSIKRIGKGYHDLDDDSTYSSATAIRKIIKKSEFEKLKKLVPLFSYKNLIEDIKKNEGPIFLENLEKTIISIFRMNNLKDFEEIYGINEGLHVRMKKAAKASSNLEGFLKEVKTRRFTLTRIKRTLISSILKLDKNTINESNLYGPQYIRILGFNEKGRNYLASIKKKIDIPIITNISDWPVIYRKILNNKYNASPELFKKQLFYDIKSTELYALFNSKKNLVSGNEFKYNVNYRRN